MSGRGAGRGRGGRGGSASSSARQQSKLLLRRSAQEAGVDLDRWHQTTLEDLTRPPLFPDLYWPVVPNNKNPEGNTKTPLPTAATETAKATPPASAPALITTKHPPATVQLVNKQRELWERFRKSAHHVQPPAPMDVPRYHHQEPRKRPALAPDVAVLRSLGDPPTSGRVVHPPPTEPNTPPKARPTWDESGAANPFCSWATDPAYIPPELYMPATGQKYPPGTRAAMPHPSNLHGKAPLRRIDPHPSTTSLDELEHKERQGHHDLVGATAPEEGSPNQPKSLPPPPPEGEEENEGWEVDPDELEEEAEDYTMNYYASDDDDNDSDGDAEATF